MAYTEADVDKLIAAVNEERAKRHAELMHPVEGKPVDAAEHEMAVLENESPPPLFEKTQFGLAVDMFDPVSGKIYTIARPGREGQTEFFPKVKQVEDMLVHGRKPVLDARKKVAAEVAKANKAEHDRVHAAEAKAAMTGPQFAKVPR